MDDVNEAPPGKSARQGNPPRQSLDNNRVPGTRGKRLFYQQIRDGKGHRRQTLRIIGTSIWNWIKQDPHPTTIQNPKPKQRRRLYAEPRRP